MAVVTIAIAKIRHALRETVQPAQGGVATLHLSLLEENPLDEAGVEVVLTRRPREGVGEEFQLEEGVQDLLHNFKAEVKD